jgi:hypothetical protein
VRRRAEFYYHTKPGKLLCQIPSIGPIRAALLTGILQHVSYNYQRFAASELQK